MPAIASLECSRCHHHLSAEIPQTVCPLCAGSLYVRYDMDKLKKTARRDEIASRAAAYPTGGGVGLIGMWKAFEEMEALGWVSGPRPKMYALQSTGCAPIAKAYTEH